MQEQISAVVVSDESLRLAATSPEIAEPAREVLHIIAAAIRDITGEVWSVPPPGRHYDVIREMRLAGYTGPVAGSDQQGFLLNDGRFCRRQAAYRVAERAKQIKDGVTTGRHLTTDDLW